MRNFEIKAAVFAALLFLLVIFAYPLIPEHLTFYPGQYPLNQEHSRSILDGLFNPAVGYPAGIRIDPGLPQILLHRLVLTLTSLDAYPAFLLSHILWLGIAYSGASLLLICLGSDKFIALALSALYLISPLVYGQFVGQYPHATAFAMLPLIIWVDFLALSKMQRWSSSLVWLWPLIIIKTFALFLNGYIFVISNLASAVLLFFNLRAQSKQIKALKICAWILSNALAFYAYRLYAPGGGSYEVMPIDFFRGQGVDLYSLLVPGKGLWLADLFEFSKSYSGPAYFGDGSQIANNFIGYLLLILSLLVVTLSRVTIKNKFVPAIAIFGLLAFGLSLGPSIKFNNSRTIAEDYQFNFNTYLMPRGVALLDLPTGLIYTKMPGIKNMRSVYRWLILSHLALFILSSLYLSALCRRSNKSRALACFLIAAIALEILPNFPYNHQRTANFYKQAQEYQRDFIKPLSRQIAKAERVFLLSDENTFLLWSIAQAIPANFYNYVGDKNRAWVMSSWPKQIKQIYARQNQNFLAPSKNAFNKGLLDALIIPFFSLRNHYYYWPPSEATVSANKEKFKNLITSWQSADLDYREEQYFGVLRPKQAKNEVHP